MHRLRPNLHCNAWPDSMPPELPSNVPSVLTQPCLLPASRRPYTLVLVTSFFSLHPDTSLIHRITINRLLPQTSTGVSGSSTFLLVTSKSHDSGLTPYQFGDLMIWVSRKSLLYHRYTVSRCSILTYSQVLILSSAFLNKPC